MNKKNRAVVAAIMMLATGSLKHVHAEEIDPGFESGKIVCTGVLTVATKYLYQLGDCFFNLPPINSKVFKICSAQQNCYFEATYFKREGSKFLVGDIDPETIFSVLFEGWNKSNLSGTSWKSSSGHFLDFHQADNGEFDIGFDSDDKFKTVFCWSTNPVPNEFIEDNQQLVLECSTESPYAAKFAAKIDFLHGKMHLGMKPMGKLKDKKYHRLVGTMILTKMEDKK